MQHANDVSQVHPQHRLGTPLPRHIAIVRVLPGLGDLLCLVPALRALRTALPAAHITLVGMPWARSIVQRFHLYLDDLLHLPGYPGLPEQTPPIRDLPAFFAQIHQLDFDLALQMHGSGIVTNPMTMLLGARLNAGFYLPGQYCPDPERFLLYPEHEHEIWRHLRLMEFLGVPLQGDVLEFPLTAEDRQALAAIEATHKLQRGEYACIHPGASTAARRWTPEQFAVVADMLAGQGLQVVLTGVAQEVELAEVVASAMRAQPINLAGRTSLGALAALLDGARLLVCNETGVSHLAAALRIPSVVVCLDAEAIYWKPLDRQRHRAVLGTQRVSTEAVLAEVGNLLWPELACTT